MLSGATVSLTDEQIKTVPTAGYEVVPAPGAGKALLLIQALITKSFGTGHEYETFDADSGLLLYVGDAEASLRVVEDSAFGGFLSNDGSGAVLLLPKHATRDETPFDPLAAPIDLSWIENQAMTLEHQSAGEFTAGNPANTMQVTVLYVIVDV